MHLSLHVFQSKDFFVDVYVGTSCPFVSTHLGGDVDVDINECYRWLERPWLENTLFLFWLYIIIHLENLFSSRGLNCIDCVYFAISVHQSILVDLPMYFNDKQTIILSLHHPAQPTDTDPSSHHHSQYSSGDDKFFHSSTQTDKAKKQTLSPSDHAAIIVASTLVVVLCHKLQELFWLVGYSDMIIR